VAKKKMTLAGFIRRFRSDVARRRGDFSVSMTGGLRTRSGRCPVEYVGRKDGAWDAGEKIGLPPNLVNIVVDASDNNHQGCGVSMFSEASPRTIGNVRGRLLRAAGVEQ